MRKWPKTAPTEGPKINQKSTKIHLWTPKGLPECTLAPNDRQSDAKVVSQDPKCSTNCVSRRLKSINVHAIMHETNYKIFGWLHTNLPGSNWQFDWFHVLNSILQIIQILQIPSILQIFQILQIPPVSKLPICCLPEGPAAGAKP